MTLEIGRRATRALPVCVLAAALATLVSAIMLAVAGAADYVEFGGPVWFSAAGAALAALALVLTRHTWVAATAILATLLLLPAAVLTVFNLLRIVGAIPLPVDWSSVPVSLCAVLTLFLLWTWARPLRDQQGRPWPTPRWVAWAGLAAAALYPALKTYWLAGGGWLRPAGLANHLDMAFLGPVLLVGMGALATLIAFRWWHQPAPRFAHPMATMGGLALAGFGTGGTYATYTRPDSTGPLLGVLVYGGWLLWGLATLAVAARLSSARTTENRAGS